MWVTPAVLCLCLGLVASAPTIADPPADNAISDTTPADGGVPVNDTISAADAAATVAAAATATTTSVMTTTSKEPPSDESDDTAAADGADGDVSYDYYDYAAEYDDYVEPTAFPFAIFDDVEPRPPTVGDALPSSCAWAVVQCCDNPDPMGSRISCFSHVGCYGAWFQDFCTLKMKKLVFKSVFQSFKFSP